MMRAILFIALLLACPGCTVVSYDRVFPKMTWAWTYQAQEQRRQNREREEGEAACRAKLKRQSIQDALDAHAAAAKLKDLDPSK